MLTLRTQRRTAFVLGAIFVVATITPPVVRHAHSDGDRPHGHDARRGHAHHHHGNSHHHGEPSGSLAEDRAHCHVYFLGWNITLPDGSLPSHDEHDDEDRGCLLCWVCDVTARSESIELIDWIEVTRVSKSIGLNVATRQKVVRHNPPITFAPLCDSARLERTGVRLI